MAAEILRWAWWGIVYLVVILVALLAVFRTAAPEAVKWILFGGILYGLALDVRQKWRDRPDRGRGPDDGDLTPVEGRA